MEMKRRGFFTLLLAPFLARFKPSPAPLSGEAICLTTKDLDQAYTTTWFGTMAPTLVITCGDTVLYSGPSPYWHGQAPFVVMESPARYDVNA